MKMYNNLFKNDFDIKLCTLSRRVKSIFSFKTFRDNHHNKFIKFIIEMNSRHHHRLHILLNVNFRHLKLCNIFSTFSLSRILEIETSTRNTKFSFDCNEWFRRFFTLFFKTIVYQIWFICEENNDIFKTRFWCYIEWFLILKKRDWFNCLTFF